MEKGRGCSQKALQYKQQHFNEVFGDLAANKAFFFSFVRYPIVTCPVRVRGLLASLKQVKETDEYKQMVESSQKKTEEVAELKKARDKAQLALKRGRWESEMHKETDLAKKYQSGALQTESEEAERKYGHRKIEGVQYYVNPPFLRQ